MSLVAMAVSLPLSCLAEPDVGCTNQNGCPTEETPSISLRESIESGRSWLSDKLFGIELSAFGDASSYYDDAGKQQFDWGAFELDASASIAHDWQAAVAFVSDTTGVTNPVGFIDYHTSGGRIAPRGRLWAEKGFHIQIGRFDVPFGNDWQFFASTDSVSVSRPITTELVMDGGYNDEGIRILGNDGDMNFNLFVMRGFNAGRLIGGRLGLTPFGEPFTLKTAREQNNFELGLSYLYDADTSWKKYEASSAVDAELRIESWSGRFEYMTRRIEPLPGADALVLSGWHFTQEYAPDGIAWPTTFFARYERGAISPPEIATAGTTAGDAADTRIAAGFKLDVGGSDVVQWKVELQRYQTATPTTRSSPGFGNKPFLFTQLVVAL